MNLEFEDLNLVNCDDVQVAAWCAVTKLPTSNENEHEAHLHIGAALAGHDQLEEHHLVELLGPSLPRLGAARRVTPPLPVPRWWTAVGHNH